MEYPTGQASNAHHLIFTFTHIKHNHGYFTNDHMRKSNYVRVNGQCKDNIYIAHALFYRLQYVDVMVCACRLQGIKNILP